MDEKRPKQGNSPWIGNLLEQCGMGVWAFDTDGNILFMSPAAWHLFNLESRFPDPGEIIGKSIRELPGWDMHQEVLAELGERSALRGLEWSFPLRQREHRWLLEDFYLETEEPDPWCHRVPWIQGVVRDISARRQKENVLFGDRLKYKQIVESLLEGYYETDIQGRITFLNRSYAALVGTTEEELLFRDLPGFPVSAGELEHLRLYRQDLLDGKNPQRMVELFRQGPGAEVLELSMSVLRDNAGEPVGFHGIMRDVTSRKRAERVVQEMQSRYSDIFDEANDIIYTHDMEGYFTSINRTGEKISEYSREEALRLKVFDIIVPEYREEAARRIRQKIEKGTEFTRYEVEIISKSGKRVPLEINSKILTVEGRPVGILGIARDITERREAEKERKRLEQQVLQAQKMEGLGVLAGGIAHDFNNLLVGVLGNAGLALRRVPKDSPVHEYLKRIEQAAQQAAELTGKMLAYSGRNAFMARPVDLSRVAREAEPLLRAGISKEVALEFDLATDLPRIYGDAAQIHQVIVNLVTNAAEAMEGKAGRVRIRTYPFTVTPEYFSQVFFKENAEPGEYVCLEVSDTGCGIPSDRISRIFDPFYSTKFSGRGLGLPVVLGIVRGHRGIIHLYSEPGTGTTFKILFPRVADTGDIPPGSRYLQVTEPSSEEETSEKESVDERARAKVLVADDELPVRQVMREVLERSGFSVTEAQDGAEAVAIFRQDPQQWKAIILDLTMPRLNGREAFDQIREIRQDIPVVIASGFAAQDIDLQFRDHPPSAFLQKPFRARDLSSLLKRVLTKS